MLVQSERPVAEHTPTSHEVYGDVMAAAQQLSILEPTYSEQRELFYGHMEVKRTHLEAARHDLRGHKGFIKDETVQLSGAYKSRGSTSAILAAFQAGQRPKRAVIASAGNAGNAVALAGNKVGLETTVECKRNASSEKVRILRGNGATVHNVHASLEEGMDVVQSAGEDSDTLAVHPFDQNEVIAGQATAGFELLADMLAVQKRGEVNLHTDPIKLFVPIGGGGLISGIACVMKWAKDYGYVGRDNLQVIGVQMEGCDAMNRAVRYMQAGEPVPEDLFAEGLPFNDRSDGTAVRKPGLLTAAVVADKEFVQDIMLVSEGELGEAMQKLTRTHGKRIEPAGALSMAGATKYARSNPASLRCGNTEALVTVTSGANVSDDLYEYFMEAARAHKETVRRQEQADVMAYRNQLARLGSLGLSDEVTAAGSFSLEGRRESRGRLLRGAFPR